jgi:DNA-binding HxlR family transcriptional regulator
MKKSKMRSDCPVSLSLEIWGDRWSLLIVRDLLIAKSCTYGDFLKSAEGIATNILASRLFLLEENKIITKMEHPDSKAKVLYRLTRKGIDLLPLIIEINIWAEKHATVSNENKEMIKAVKADRAGYIKAVTKTLEKAIPVCTIN